jgi:hypothetical protein
LKSHTRKMRDPPTSADRLAQMTEREPGATELREAVERAFADRQYPGDGRIADSDPPYESYKGHAISAFHRGKGWQEITLRHLLDEYAGDPTASLAFMTPEGWRYYLPAYLLMALDWDEADAIGDATVRGRSRILAHAKRPSPASRMTSASSRRRSSQRTASGSRTDVQTDRRRARGRPPRPGAPGRAGRS